MKLGGDTQRNSTFLSVSSDNADMANDSPRPDYDRMVIDKS